MKDWMRARARGLTAIALAAGFAACGEDPEPLPGTTDAGPADVDAGSGPTSMTLLELARSEGLTTFVATATAAGLQDRLDGVDPLTVLAPTNQAFERFAFDAPTDPALLENILLNHVFPAVQRFDGASSGAFAQPSLAHVWLEFGDGELGGARFDARVDLEAENGLLTVAQDVLSVPRVGEFDRAWIPDGAFAEVIRGASTLAQDPYFGPGPVTVFAPTGAALIGFGPLPPADALLGAHVASGQRLAAELRDGDVITLEDGSTVTVEIDAEGVSLVDGEVRARVTTTDIRLANGVVHLIDQVLAPRAFDVIDVATREGLTAFVAAVQTAGLLPLLTGDGPFTVFAPTNRAFAAAMGGLPRDPSLLANFLLTHVLVEPVDRERLAAASPVRTAANTDLAVVVDRGGGLLVGGAPVSALVDLEATNGVVHVIDQVIVPRTILEEVAARSELSQLSALVDRGTRALPRSFVSRTGVTFFAPSDRALMMVDTGTVTGAPIDAIVRGHITANNRTLADLANSRFRLLSGGMAAVQQSDRGTVALRDPARPDMPIPFSMGAVDVRLRDGMLHVIDGVLGLGR